MIFINKEDIILALCGNIYYGRPPWLFGFGLLRDHCQGKLKTEQYKCQILKVCTLILLFIQDLLFNILLSQF